MTLRHVLSWKPWFYKVLLPALRQLGPARADATLGWLGQVASLACLPRQRALELALRRPQAAYQAGWNIAEMTPRFAASTFRFLARDYPLDGASDDALFARFDVEGFEHVTQALARGQGLILLGNHLGGYLAALHWLYRRGVPLRLLVQRPQHVSRYLRARFQCPDGPHPQPELFLRRGLAPGTAAERMLRARAALRDGLAVYLTSDIPWTGPNARPGRLIGHTHSFLSVWADLAALARVPVVPLFCTHRPAGRYALTFDPPLTVPAGKEIEAVKQVASRLDGEIARQPADAVAHLLWPCYQPSPGRAARSVPRVSTHCQPHGVPGG